LASDLWLAQITSPRARGRFVDEPDTYFTIIRKPNTSLLERVLNFEHGRKVPPHNPLLLLDALKRRKTYSRGFGQFLLSPSQKGPRSPNLSRISHPPRVSDSTSVDNNSLSS
jgi:hypothetical protein